MSWLLVGIVQLGVLFFVVELLVSCMPSALRSASHQNCFRMGGTRSGRRTHREERAKNRVRRDMFLVMLLVMLLGNVVYFVIDGTIAPMGSIATRVEQSLIGSSDSPESAAHRESVIEAGQKFMKFDFEQFKRAWPRILAFVLIWTLLSFWVVARAAMMSYKTFGEGVQARSAEYFQTDMTRMTVTDSQLAAELLRSQPNSNPTPAPSSAH